MVHDLPTKLMNHVMILLKRAPQNLRSHMRIMHAFVGDFVMSPKQNFVIKGIIFSVDNETRMCKPLFFNPFVL